MILNIQFETLFFLFVPEWSITCVPNTPVATKHNKPSTSSFDYTTLKKSKYKHFHTKGSTFEDFWGLWQIERNSIPPWHTHVNYSTCCWPFFQSPMDVQFERAIQNQITSNRSWQVFLCALTMFYRWGHNGQTTWNPAEEHETSECVCDCRCLVVGTTRKERKMPN